MSDREEWGPWIEHDGKSCPVRIGEYVKVELKWKQLSHTFEGVIRRHYPDGGDWNWRNYPNCWKVLRYRVKKPRALQQLREMIETLPAPSRQKEDAHV